MIDGKDANAVDNTAVRLPTLVYVAREKRPQYHHNFKAGAMNALVRIPRSFYPATLHMQIIVHRFINSLQ